jgi:hypothetical protein
MGSVHITTHARAPLVVATRAHARPSASRIPQRSRANDNTKLGNSTRGGCVSGWGGDGEGS